MQWRQKDKLESRTEKVRVKLKFIETYLAPAILHGLEAWERILKKGIDEMEKVQKKQ